MSALENCEGTTDLELVTSAEFSSAGPTALPGSLQLASFAPGATLPAWLPAAAWKTLTTPSLTPFKGSPYPALLTLSPPGGQQRVFLAFTLLLSPPLCNRLEGAKHISP